MEPTIIFDHVSKKFSRTYVSDSLRDTLTAPFKKLFGMNGNESDKENKEFWALKDVNFEVKPGEALGIIGPNGSGKSTTLKLLARILRPDGGRIEARGRVGALIELAAGFHPDLTGRENVFLNASILGMTKKEIAKKYEQIVDFSELHEFMDTPVKWYSSGMYARLGFSVAAHIDPDVLLIDEVLSVGDIGFQQKCQTKIQTIKDQGLTIVFVSHNMSAIASVCDQVLVIDKGEKVFLGSSHEAVSTYINISMSKSRDEIQNTKIVLVESCIRDAHGNHKLAFAPGENCSISLCFRATHDLENINIGVKIRKKETASVVFASHYTALTGQRISLDRDQEVRITFALSLNLTQGIYVLETVAYDQLRNQYLLVREITTLVIKDTVKCDGIAFLDPVITEFSINKGVGSD